MSAPAPAEARPIVVQTEDIHAAASAWLAERCEVVRCAPGDTAALLALLANADALLVRTYTRVDVPLLAHAPRLRCVARAGVGIDNIDVNACAARGVRVVHTPDANSDAVAEFVVALLVDALRPRAYLSRAVPISEWSSLRAACVAPRQLAGLTLGVWGLGRVGSRAARAGAGLGMRVIYHDLEDKPPASRHGAQPVSRDELLAGADALSIHVDARPANRHLLAHDALARLKPDAVIINTSRGMVVDHDALAAFLRARPGAMALLDVHDPEPIEPDNPLLGLGNARLSPHLAAATRQAHEAMSWVVLDLWRVLRGEAPAHPAPP